MIPNPMRAIAPVALLLTVTVAGAQPVPGAARADAMDPGAEVPAQRHESAFAGYRRLGDEPVMSWREANETVNRIGGWRAYARETAEPAQPARDDGDAGARRTD